MATKTGDRWMRRAPRLGIGISCGLRLPRDWGRQAGPQLHVKVMRFRRPVRFSACPQEAKDGENQDPALYRDIESDLPGTSRKEVFVRSFDSQGNLVPFHHDVGAAPVNRIAESHVARGWWPLPDSLQGSNRKALCGRNTPAAERQRPRHFSANLSLAGPSF